MEEVVIIDSLDNKLGLVEKIEAHKQGLLHRAISVVLLNEKNQMLIQQRSGIKYHWPLKWANACCSHPKNNESYENAAYRRMKEELGISDIKLELAFTFIYKIQDPTTKLIEHELDYVFKGMLDNRIINFNKLEINKVKWIDIDFLKNDVLVNDNNYCFWFKKIIEKF